MILIRIRKRVYVSVFVPKYQQVMLVPLWLSWSSLLSIVGCGPCDNTYIYEQFIWRKKLQDFLLPAPMWKSALIGAHLVPLLPKKRWQDGGSTPSFTYNSNYVTLSDAMKSNYNMGPSLKTIALSDVDSAARWLHNVRRLMGLPGYAQEHF